MKILTRIFATLAIVLPATFAMQSCHNTETWENDLYGNFDALWTVIDEHYCFFKYKDIDWNEIGQRYRDSIKPDWNEIQLYDHCAKMLNELRDGHTNLISWFNVSYYNKWWSDYPQNFNERLIEQYYFKFENRSGGGFKYKILEDRKVGYIRYSTFSVCAGHDFIDWMLYSMKDLDGIIIDVRDNGGGDISNVEKIVSHFITEKTLGGYIQHKTGPGHDDFSEPYPYYYESATDHVRWLKPVIVLANRSTFSAANNFVVAMKALPQVAVVGDRTGGGCGMPFSSEVPCGWGVRFSASPVYDTHMQLTESGVDPTEGGELDMDPEQEEKGIDTIIEFAIEALNKAAEKYDSTDTEKKIIGRIHPGRSIL